MPLDKVLGRRAFIDRLPMMPLIFILLPPPYGMDHNWSSCFFTRKQLPYHAVVLIFLEFVPRGKHVLAEARLGKSVKVVYGMMVAFLPTYGTSSTIRIEYVSDLHVPSPFFSFLIVNSYLPRYYFP